MHFICEIFPEGVHWSAPEGIFRGEENMSTKSESIDYKLNQIIDALIKLGCVGVGSPQVVEIRTDEDGYIDIPLKVRVAV